MCHNQRVFENLIQEVGLWSSHNFGIQQSKWSTTRNVERNSEGVPTRSLIASPILLDHVAPLLGIIEEIGELEAAVKVDHPELIRDSIGDTLIYLADYFYRTGLPADLIDWHRLSTDECNTVFLSREKLIVIGMLIHANLKRHQGIRDYAGPRFNEEVGSAITNIMILLRLTYINTHPRGTDPTNPLRCLTYTPQEGTDAIIAIAGSVWEHVRKRNWVANPTTGGV